LDAQPYLSKLWDFSVLFNSKSTDSGSTQAVLTSVKEIVFPGYKSQEIKHSLKERLEINKSLRVNKVEELRRKAKFETLIRDDQNLPSD